MGAQFFKKEEMQFTNNKWSPFFHKQQIKTLRIISKKTLHVPNRDQKIKVISKKGSLA